MAIAKAKPGVPGARDYIGNADGAAPAHVLALMLGLNALLSTAAKVCGITARGANAICEANPAACRYTPRAAPWI